MVRLPRRVRLAGRTGPVEKVDSNRFAESVRENVAHRPGKVNGLVDHLALGLCPGREGADHGTLHRTERGR